MRALMIGTVLAMTITISACSDDSSDGAVTATTVATDGTAIAVADVPDVIGQSVEDATATLEAAGLTLRIVRKDGEDLAATADFLVNRVNVAVETKDGNEVVTEVVSTG